VIHQGYTSKDVEIVIIYIYIVKCKTLYIYIVRESERPSHRWEDNIKNGPSGGCGGMDWIKLSQDRDRWQAHVNSVMDLRVP